MSRGAAATAALLWIVTVLLNWTVVMMAVLQTITGAHASELILQLAGVWLLVEIIAGLLPFVAWLGLTSARQQAAARPLAMGTVAGGIPGQFASQRLSQPSATTFLRFLNGLAEQSAPTPPGIRLEPDGAIVSTQAALARASACSKGYVNKCLHQLAGEERIELGTAGRETRIRLPPLPLRNAA
jgi:hypothetical protein